SGRVDTKLSRVFSRVRGFRVIHDLPELDGTFTQRHRNRVRHEASPPLRIKVDGRLRSPQKARCVMSSKRDTDIRDLAARVERLEGWFVAALLGFVGALVALVGALVALVAALVLR